MLPEIIRVLINEANKPGFIGAPIPVSVNVTKELINEAISYSNSITKDPQNAIGLIISELIRRYEEDELVINQGVDGVNFLFSGPLNSLKITVKGNVKGKYICHRLYTNVEIIIKGDLVGNYAGNLISEGSLIVEGNIRGNDAGEDMSGGSIKADSIIGNHTGKEMNSGTITTNSIHGDYTGEDMSDGLITVNGDIIGSFTGLEMSGGEIKVAGSIKGDYTGEELYGGSIIVKGEIKGEGTGNNMIKGRIKARNISKKEQ